MRSSSGAHFIALDHVRALAALMVVTWHFHNAAVSGRVRLDYVPSFIPFAVLDEGHTGVALFMTLSGYLFAKLLDGKEINFGAFLWNRFVRLVPLLVLALFFAGVLSIGMGYDTVETYAASLAKGWLLPTLPNGAWSITVEFHFYLLLPLLLWMQRKSRFLPLLLVGWAIAIRCLIYLQTHDAQSAAYWTIVGRFDQFALGMLAFQFRGMIAGRHALAAACIAVFLAAFWYFDSLGGFYQMPSYPSTSSLWIILPTIEGLGYAIAIAWYESSFKFSTTGASGYIGRIGAYSYSIYLLHFFFVGRFADLVNSHVMGLANFYVACAWALVFFLMMYPVGHLSFRYVESPFLRFRRTYIRPTAAQPYALGGAGPVRS